MSTRYGPRPVEAVRFRNDTYPARVLGRVWREHDTVRHLVIEWLQALGTDVERVVRIRAAAAVGLLATFEFDWVRLWILQPWADDVDPDVRESAVSALRLPSATPGLGSAVSQMVRDWAKRGNRRRRWTAARALGASVGRVTRPEAIALLRRLAAKDDRELMFAVSDSMVELFLAPEESATRDVLTALGRWTGVQSPATRRRTGLVAFLQLAIDVRIEDDDGTTWPALLWFAQAGDEDFGCVTRVWRRALTAPYIRPGAWHALGVWVAMAGEAGTPRVGEELGRVVEELRTGRDAEHLAGDLDAELGHMAKSRKGATAAAARALLDRLAAKEVNGE